MSIRVALQHHTSYHFDKAVTVYPHVVRLRPAPHTRTAIEAYSLRVTPGPCFINWQQDVFGNYQARLVFPQPRRLISIDVDLIANLAPINPFDFFLEEYATLFPFTYDEALRRDLAPYLELRESGPLLLKRVAGISRKPQPTTGFIFDVNRHLQADIAYTVRMEPGVQSCEHTLSTALGSCRDTAWLLTQILRHLGLAARFVSGYLVQLKADQKPLDGPAGPAQDFTDLHAWTEVYLPGAGWVGMDPTSGLFAGEGHIPLACSPNPDGAAPITGATAPCTVEFGYRNHVQRVSETPRVTRPYDEVTWQAIDQLGEQVDADLTAGDVRLTQGGEPTFVSVDDMESEQWNTAADGPEKRALAQQLARRLGEHFGAGGVLHHSQGKWYPGEPLPRWQIGCLWRTDGATLWQDAALLADPTKPGSASLRTAREFMEALTRRLGLPASRVITAYEDPAWLVWQENRLPANLDPVTARLDDPAERRRIAHLLERGPRTPAGYVLPLGREASGDGWRSSDWPLRREQLFLAPGDSPLGLRLPLDSLPWVHPKAREVPVETSLFEPRAPLPPVRAPQTRKAAPPAPTVATEPAHVVHTALCAQVRDGHLWVFLPPLTQLEAWLELMQAIEACAAEARCPVALEGYEAPRDPRLQRLNITPDPGVIEVNVHPVGSWRALVEQTTTLYALARECRLGTEKFMLDGHHTGTGGGNHMTLGGATPDASPLLRRPDLLRSLVTYWQRHPGLSYLFSGAFIGPTSQSPRVDEARHEALYELEIAFQQLPSGEVPQPWLVDRLLRHLLVDMTGNTHRAEFCIDKLYAPNSATGRLGLLELRAFEMPPHPQMALLQSLLVRALVAWFWQEPCVAPLVRWGTSLHDRYLLPHYVASDLGDVLADLRGAGYGFIESWLAPFLEFRFPLYGSVQVGPVHLELRSAIEPWHVLGEEVTRAGTSRYVDSSLERLQVRARGLAEGRYAVACNGHRVPMHGTGVIGELVAGVRYRAWQPPSALHPTIGIHAPLVFDVVDTWNGRSLGGCTYHVVHPGGRSYDVFPVNAGEAQGRRGLRFEPRGHTPGPMHLPPLAPNSDYPCTLDLRRVG